MAEQKLICFYMNYLLEYEEFGEINRTAPLEAFYETMRPVLKNYGLTAEFPADKPSLAESINGIEHDVFVGDAPNAVRYLKWQGSPYANGGFELTLESETLVHKKTGNKLAFKIFISDYIRGMKHESGNFSLILKFRGEKSEVEALRKAIAPVLEKYNFQSHEVKKAQIIADNLEEKSNKNLNSELMTNNVNFDELAQKAFAPTAVSTDFENLFAAVFSLDAWYFIADAEFQYKMPYCAPFKVFDDAITLTVFTDGERARKYIAEGGLKGGAAVENSAPEDLTMRISTDGILDFFDRLAPFNIAKIFFNPNIDSHGFHHDLKMMRPIYEHVKNKGLLAQTESQTATQNNEDSIAKLIEENADVIAEFERENEMFSSIIAGSASALDDDASEEDIGRVVSNTADMFESVRVKENMTPKLFRAYIQTCLEKRQFLMPTLAFAYFHQSQIGIKKLAEDKELANEMAQFFIKKAVPDADFLMDEPVPKSPGKYYSIFQRGSVRPDFTYAPFFDVLVPLLVNYRGTGEFTESFSPGTDETNMSNLIESSTANADGDYLKMKFYTYRGNAGEPPLSFKILGSNLLKNVKTGERLIVRFTMSKTPADASAKLIVNLLGSESEVLKIYDALRPALDSFDYKVLLRTEGEPQPESLKLLEDDAPETIPETNPQTNKPPEKDFPANASSEEKSVVPAVDFDALSEKAMATNAMEDLNALFGAAFALDKWNFIARGELPNVGPYIASNPAAADNQPMVRAFTDADRLMRFARENNLTDADGSANILTIPTENIIPYLEGFTSQGAFGVWFNSDSQSKDFFIPIKQLQPIKDHLAKLNQSENSAKKSSKKTLLLLVQDGLGFPSGFVSEASFKLNIFCRVPENWTDGERLTTESQEKIFEFLYGANWRNGNDDGSRYVVIDSFSKVFDDETVKNTRWEGTENTDTNHFKFYLVSADGAIKSVKAEEFQADIDAELKRQKVAENRQAQDNAAKFGVSETADGSFDQNLNLNQVGTVNFETSIAPFYEAIVPLLKDFQGTGEYLTLLRFEESGKSQEVENIAENAHGAYLQIRRFLYLNPKNNVRIGVNSIHSNHLRHVQTNAELILSFELCKNLDNQTGVFYHAFQGPKSEVLKLSAAIQPILEANGYQAVQ